MGFTYLTSGGCPVCGGERRDCRRDGELIFCRTDTPNTGWKLVKYDQQGFGVFIEGNEDTPNYKRLARKKTKKVDDRVRLSGDKRNQAYLELSQQTKLDTIHYEKLLKRGLSPETIKDRLFRSFKPKEKVKLSVAYPSISKGTLLVRDYGYSVPVTDVHGNIISYQLRIEDSKNKYIWACPVNIGNARVTSHNDKLELPIQIVDKGTELVGLCEGTLKPIIASEIHNISFLGASGGHFLSSKKTFKETLDTLGKDKKYVFFLDAGFGVADKRGNYQVLESAKKICHWMVDNGYDVSYGYINNALDKELPDVDETDSYEIQPIDKLLNYGGRLLSQLTTEETGWMAKMTDDGYLKMFTDELMQHIPEEEQDKPGMKLTWEQSLDTEVPYIPGQLPGKLPDNVVFTFKPDQRTQFYKEAKDKGHYRVLDISGCGTGKSYTAGTMTAEDFFKPKGDYDREVFARNNKLVYLTQQPRNPATKTLEDNFAELPSRHVGVRYEKSTLTENGNYYRKRVTKAEDADELGNCHLAEMFVAIRGKRIHENLCGTCPFQKTCRRGKGASWTQDNKKAPYGYEHQKVHVLNNESEIIASATGFSHKLMGSNKLWAGIVDEYSQTLNPIETIKVSRQMFDSTLGMMGYYDGKFVQEVHNIFRRVYPFLNGQGDIPFYGINDHDVKQLLNEIPQDKKMQHLTTVENINHERMEAVRGYLRTGTKNRGVTATQINSLEVNWLTPFFKVWAKQSQGAFHLSHEGLTIYIRNEMMVDTLNSLRFVVLQDATGTRSHLSHYLDCRPEDILVCKAIVKEEKNVKVIQITGMGNPANKRSQDTARRIKAIRKELSEQYPNMIGFMDYKNHAHKGDLHHLSTARGSNLFKNMKAVCSVGIPCSSLTTLRHEFVTFTRQKPEGKEFNNFVNNIRSGELIQEMGRLRAERRDEDLIYYVITDDNIDWLSDLGYEHERVACETISPKAANRKELIKQQIYYAAMESLRQTGDIPNMGVLADKVGVTSRVVSEMAQFHELKEFYAEQYTLVRQIIAEAQTAIDDRTIEDIIEEVVSTSKVEDRQDIKDVLSIYAPGFLEAYVKDSVDRTAEDVEIVDYITTMREVYDADWQTLEKYAAKSDFRSIAKKMKKLPVTIQQLWKEQKVCLS